MKTLRFIGMAIIAIIMSVNFVACSDDDDDNPMLVHGEVKSLMTVKAIVIHIHSMQTEAVYGKSLKMVNKLIQNHLSTL